ncbi:MAG: hypothetical protein QOG43_2747 [Actinomycetota bacterium]|jgi:hypothetical protein|nr:hypothetical protein [Actinomycetota bacterium]
MEREVIVLRLGAAGDWEATIFGQAEPMCGGSNLARCRAGIRRALISPDGGRRPWDERVELPAALAEVVEAARREREAALEQQRRSQDATQVAVFRLAEELMGKLAMRDIARLVGVSHQRVQQVLAHQFSGRGAATL